MSINTQESAATAFTQETYKDGKYKSKSKNSKSIEECSKFG